jgi:hypothetical protein
VSDLHEIQRGFAHSMLTAEDAAVATRIDQGALAPAECLAIYRNTFHGVVVNAMRLTYPVIERLVGPEFFEGAARLFLAQNPPHSACLSDYGGDFDVFLARLPEAAPLAYLPDVARLEWAVAQAAVAEDAPLLDPAALMEFPADALGDLRLVPHPSLQMVDLTWPADAIWHAIADDNEDALSTIQLAGPPFTLLLHRGEDGIVFRRLSETERAVTLALKWGRTLGTVLEAAPEGETMALLAEHLAAGRFTRVEHGAVIQGSLQ